MGIYSGFLSEILKTDFLKKWAKMSSEILNNIPSTDYKNYLASNFDKNIKFNRIDQDLSGADNSTKRYLSFKNRTTKSWLTWFVLYFVGFC